MKKLVLGLLLCICVNQFAIAQFVEDVVVVEAKSHYKKFFKGEAKFESECATCHGINEPVISVALYDVHTKRSREWLLEFLQKPRSFEYKFDEETEAYRKEYGAINHETFRNLDEKDFQDILNFLEGEYNGNQYDESLLKEEYFVLEKNKDIKNGDYKYYFPSGRLSHFYYYNMGLPWEVKEVYDDFGARKEGGTLKNGTGTLIVYDEYGNKESVTTYVRGFRSGEYKQYFDGGEIELLGFYSNGKANGKWSYFYHNGTVKNTINYRDGRVLSNKEGDKPDYNPGGGISVNYGTYESPSNVYQAPDRGTTKNAAVSSTILYPYNESIRWEKGEANNPIYTKLGNDFITLILLNKMDDLYINASTNFKRYHPPIIVEGYKKEIVSYGDFAYYRLDNVGFVRANGRQVILMEYYLSYAHQNIKMYINYILEDAQYKLDGWSFDIAD